MSDFQGTIRLILTMFVITVAASIGFLGFQDALPVLLIMSLIFLPIVIIWGRHYVKFRKSKFRTFEAFWQAEQLK